MSFIGKLVVAVLCVVLIAVVAAIMVVSMAWIDGMI